MTKFSYYGAILPLFTLFYPFLLFFTPLESQNLIFQLYWILLCTLLIKSFSMICHTCISKKFDKCWQWWGKGDFLPPPKREASQNYVWPLINYCFLSLKDYLCQFSCLYRNMTKFSYYGGDFPSFHPFLPFFTVFYPFRVAKLDFSTLLNTFMQYTLQILSNDMSHMHIQEIW